MRALLISLALTAASTSACLGDQSYTPIGEDREDDLCPQSKVDLIETQAQALELDEAGAAVYQGSLEVTEFTRTSMRVETEELIVSIPAGSITTLEVAPQNYEYFSEMVFAVDVRQPGDQNWRPIEMESDSYQVSWFSTLEFNGNTESASFETLALCTATAINAEQIQLPKSELSGDHELRIRVLPFDGIGDAVGAYDYDLSIRTR